MGNVILQVLIAFFAALGVFAAAWRCALFCVRRSLRCREIRILLSPAADTDLSLLWERLPLFLAPFAPEEEPEVWVLCDGDDPVRARCGELRDAYPDVQVMTGDEAAERLQRS